MPVPCVAVPSAPPSDCLLMSGRLAIARPWAASAGPRSPSLVPARTVASSPFTDTRPPIRSRESSVPSVGTSGMKEWPAPTARIGAGAVFSRWGKLVFRGGLGARHRIGMADPRPVAPDEMALRVGAGRRGRLGLGPVLRRHSRRHSDASPPRAAVQSGPRREILTAPPAAHEPDDGPIIGRRTGGALAAGRHRLEAQNCMARQRVEPLRPARVPRIMVVHQRRAGPELPGVARLAAVFVEFGGTGIRRLEGG